MKRLCLWRCALWGFDRLVGTTRGVRPLRRRKDAGVERPPPFECTATSETQHAIAINLRGVGKSPARSEATVYFHTDVAWPPTRTRKVENGTLALEAQTRIDAHIEMEYGRRLVASTIACGYGDAVLVQPPTRPRQLCNRE